MSGNDRISPVVRRYAEALFELAASQGLKDRVLADLTALHEVLATDRDLASRLFNPLVQRGEKKKLVESSLLPGRHPFVARLLLLLVERRRETVLRGLLDGFVRAVEEAEGVVRARVESAVAMDAAETDSMRSRLESATGRRVVLEAAHRPDLIGGIRLTVGDRVLDASLARRIERIHETLSRASLK